MGDDAQILSLARALGWPFEVKRLAYRRLGRVIDVWRGSNRLGVHVGRSSALRPPWPDLVLSASMRNEPICRWVRRQSGGRTRYVHIGKPWARVPAFDLVIAGPEYWWLPAGSNVVRNACSLHDVRAASLAEAARLWAPSVAHLRRPRIALLVGGYAGPYPFDRANAMRLGREASAFARRQGGSLLVTTSARTSASAIEGLLASIDVPHVLHRWQRGGEANPYLGFLGLADSIIVTSDSTSMLAEACATGKPVSIFDLAVDAVGRGRTCIEGDERRARTRPWARVNRDRTLAFFYRNVLLRFAPTKIKRDIGRVHESLIASGHAVWFGDPAPDRMPPPLDPLPRSVERVRRLFSGGRTPIEEVDAERALVQMRVVR
ncbi:MAG: ELM1/GtrOC1 family putative glycosyltransferase [Myxococcota bacterium]